MADSMSLIAAVGDLALPLLGFLPAFIAVDTTALVEGTVKFPVDLDLSVRVSFVMDILSLKEYRIAKAL